MKRIRWERIALLIILFLAMWYGCQGRRAEKEFEYPEPSQSFLDRMELAFERSHMDPGMMYVFLLCFIALVIAAIVKIILHGTGGK